MKPRTHRRGRDPSVSQMEYFLHGVTRRGAL
jgi:hypothetical protein